jgi:hypothetical protein
MTDPTTAPPRAPVALARDLGNFLVELAIALQNFGVYPPGHPFLARSALAVAERLDAALRDRDALSFGVARGQLVIGGVATDASNPVLTGLADRLHRHRVGAVTLRRGLEVAEVASLLGFLAGEGERGGPGDGSGHAWAHARLHPLSYAQLELTGDDPAADAADPRRTRAAQLWVGLARAALASGDGDGEPPAPEQVARAIEQHAQAAAYDQVIVGYLLQLAEELRTEERGSAEVRRRLSETLRRLSPETLARLLEMGGDRAQRHRFLRDAGHGLAADAVVRLVQTAAETEGHAVSHSMVRLLNKLAAHAGQPPGAASAAADAALREQVDQLVGGWSLADPTPGTYGRMLDRMSRTVAGGAAIRPEPGEREDERVLEMSLEVGANGPAVWTAVRALEAAGRVHLVVERAAAAPEAGELVEALWAYACRPEGVRALLRTAAEAPAALNAAIARLGADTVPPLLDELAESESRTVRRAAIDRVVSLGPGALPEVGRRMGDERWYVVRNLLSIVAAIGRAPEGFSAAPFLRHPDVRVRREAFKAAFRLGGDRARVLGLALTDADAQVQRVALAECGDDCPGAVLPLVCRRIDDPAAEREVAVAAVRVLGGSRDPLALATLVRIASAGHTLLRRVRLAPPTPRVLAALSALARGWAAHPAAAPVLDAARRSPDPLVLQALHAPSS